MSDEIFYKLTKVEVNELIYFSSIISLFLFILVVFRFQFDLFVVLLLRNKKRKIGFNSFF